MKKTSLVLTIVWLFLFSSLCLGADDGASKTVTNDGIEVTISTDKASYEAGETVNYKIEVVNNKYMWQMNTMKFDYTNLDGFISASEGSMPNEIPLILSGESYVLEGSMVGDGSFAETLADNNEEKENGTGSDLDSKADSNNVDTSPSILSTAILISLVSLGLLVIVIFFFIRSKKGKKSKGIKSLLIIGLISGMVASTVPLEAAEYETIKIRPYVEFVYGGQEVMIRTVMEVHVLQTRLTVESDQVNKQAKITCHDPSIFKDFDGTYYIVGTHITGGYTTNLFDWTSTDAQFRGSLSEETRTLIRAWNKDGNGNKDWFGYLWAPDIIYNKEMEKYCIYLSANGDDWKSNIVLLTSDTVNGEYEYAGSVVMGGFTADTYDETDVAQVTGESQIPERYLTHGIENRKWGDKWPNVIDACVFYDDDGKLWMSYGSWSGGIFMLELDESTGLRDYEVTYETGDHSDAYFGKKIAGGAYVSGEASYIQKVGDYYYLFMSNGGLEAKGGYNIRVFRSETPDGPYVDEKGNSALYDSYVFNYNLPVGIRIFGNYKWRSFNYGEVAQGHNSAFVDDDGKAYIVFHTRTTNGSEGHYVKVHQLFVTKEGWLVAAPYQTYGETMNPTGYSVSEIAGSYEVILHTLDVDYSNLETNKPDFIELEEDGSISGDYKGSWRLEPGTSYINLTIDGQEYSGVSLEMKVEKTTVDTFVFTALGKDNQLTLWGSKMID